MVPRQKLIRMATCPGYVATRQTNSDSLGTAGLENGAVAGHGDAQPQDTVKYLSRTVRRRAILVYGSLLRIWWR